MVAKAVDTDLVVTGIVNATTIQQGGASVQMASVISGNGYGIVNHGATADTARPSGFAYIHWVGSVEPTNAINGDTWVDTS